jgi:hypothetical protein
MRQRLPVLVLIQGSSMRQIIRAGLSLAALCSLLITFNPAQAQDDIRELHRTLALAAREQLLAGIELQGTIDQNGSQGEFKAWFYDGDYLIREHFSGLESYSYRTADGAYSGSNHSLPYRVEAGDSPASNALGMLSSGKYLDDPHWESFVYVGEEAGAYRFRFTPAGLPPVEVLLYNDADEPEFLQLMSTEVGLAPEDDHSIRHRSFYYYALDADGKLYTNRETGRELDQDGQTVNFSEYTVEQFSRSG